MFRDLKEWLQSISTDSTDNQQPEIIKIRDQLCAGFFLIYCKKFEESREFLLQVEDFILPEYFDALQGELEKRNENILLVTGSAAGATDGESKLSIISSKLSAISAKYSKILTNFLLFMREFAWALLEKMKNRNALVVAAIRSNAKNFALFCKKLIEILLKGMRIL